MFVYLLGKWSIGVDWACLCFWPNNFFYFIFWVGLLFWPNNSFHFRTLWNISESSSSPSFFFYMSHLLHCTVSSSTVGFGRRGIFFDTPEPARSNPSTTEAEIRRPAHPKRTARTQISFSGLFGFGLVRKICPPLNVIMWLFIWSLGYTSLQCLCSPEPTLTTNLTNLICDFW